MRALIVALLSFACSCATLKPAPPRIVAGEILVTTDDPNALATEPLATATGRSDFVVREKDCLTMRVCRLVVERVGAVADEAWTRALIDAIAVARPAGVQTVEPNTLEEIR